MGVAYIGAIGAANLLTTRYGLVPGGFGLAVTAGTYTAGLALTLRDTLHDLAGPHLVIAAIVIAACCSALSADPRMAAASAVAAAAAELTDMAVYVPLRRRSRTTAIAVSGLAGATLDSLGFL